ncbi:endospore germination permease [Cytobacillus kochii]
MNQKLSFISIAYIMILGIGLFAHVEIIPAVLSTSGRDTWISMLLAIIPLILFTPLIYKVGQTVKGTPFIRIISEQLGRFKFYILFFPLLLYLIISAFVSTKEIIYWSQLSFMQNFSSMIIGGVLLIACFYCSFSGVESMAIISRLLLPVVVFLGFFVSFANMKKKHYELLLPIFQEGVLDILKGMFYTSLPIIEIAFVLFFLPQMKGMIKIKHLIILGVLIIGLMIGPAIGAIVEFGPKYASEFRYPAFEEWRIISIGRYISHTDFFAIFQWLSGATIRIGFFIYLTSQILTKGEKNRTPISIIFILLFIAVVMPLDQDLFYNFVFRYFLPISTIVLPIQFIMVSIYIFKNKQLFLGG